MNYFKIVGAFICFYIFNTLHFWGVFELSINAPETGTLFQVIAFSVTVFVLGIMLISGSRSNHVKQQTDFLKEEWDRLQQVKDDEQKIKDRVAAHAGEQTTFAPMATPLAINDDVNDAGRRMEMDGGDDADADNNAEPLDVLPDDRN